MANVRNLYKFREQRFQTFTHNIKIYIFGVEVSRWLRGSLTITYGNRDSYNTASFELANPKKIWQITEKNLYQPTGVFTFGLSEFSEDAKKAIFSKKNDPAFNNTWELNVTKGIFGAKTQSSATETLKQSQLYYSPSFKSPKPLAERKYRLNINDCIIHKNDPIRIFIHNPLVPQTAGQWMEVFCGFIQEHPITTNYITGESTLRISCYCIKQLMHKMRVQMNTMINMDPQPTMNIGFYKDFIKTNFKTHPYAQTSLENTIKDLVLGATKAAAVISEGDEVVLPGGVGSFRLGNIVCYDPSNPEDILARWHLMTLFGVNKVPFPTGETDELWLTPYEMRKLGENTIPFLGIPKKQVPVGGPDGRFLHFLIPKSGTGPGDLISYTTDTNPKAREWTSRWEIIRDFASRMDFQVLTSPSGDILVEFPQYGFTPCAYKKPFSTNCDKIGGLQNVLTFDLHQKEDTLNDEAEDFPTILTVSGGIAHTDQNPQTPDTTQPMDFIFAPTLVDRYGVVQEHVDFPWVASNSQQLGTNVNKSPILKRLAQLGLIEYTKRIANAATWQGSVVYRPFLFPNRPVELIKSARVGLLNSVSHTWQINDIATTTISINSLMSKREDGSYRLITGAYNVPIDYGKVWSSDDYQSSDTGVVTGKKILDDNKSTPTDPQDPNQPSQAIPKDALSSSSTGDLYPPFGNMIDKLKAEFQKITGKELQINNGLRNTAEQYRIIQSNHPYTVAGIGTSYHQYGFAVDFDLGASKTTGDAVQKINLSLFGTLPLKWGGTTDPVHFQIPKYWSGFMNPTKALSMVTNHLKVSTNNESSALKEVWSYLDKQLGIISDEAKVPELPAGSFATTGFSGAANASSSGATTGTTPPAPPCKEVRMKKPGVDFKKLA